MKVAPITLRQANAFVAEHHRHHKPSRGHKFSIAAIKDGEVIGVAIAGRPVARACDDGVTIEVSRLCTLGEPNACSMLYSAVARAAKAMGYQAIQTYILESEPGTSLRAAGWRPLRRTLGRDWNCPSRGGRRTDQPMDDKIAWGRSL